MEYSCFMGFPGVSVVKNPPAMQETRVWSMVRKIPWRRKWQPTLAFLPGKSHGQRSLAGYSPQGHKRVGHDLVIKQQHNNKIFALKCCASFCCRARWISYQSVSQFSHSVMSKSLQPHELQHARPPCPSPTPRVHSNSRPSGWWCHPAISSSVVPFSSCPQSLPASESFPMSQLFAWGAKVLEFQLEHHFFQRTPRADLL